MAAAAQSLKGGAGCVGALGIHRLAHELEVATLAGDSYKMDSFRLRLREAILRFEKQAKELKSRLVAS